MHRLAPRATARRRCPLPSVRLSLRRGQLTVELRAKLNCSPDHHFFAACQGSNTCRQFRIRRSAVHAHNIMPALPHFHTSRIQNVCVLIPSAHKYDAALIGFNERAGWHGDQPFGRRQRNAGRHKTADR